MISPGTPRLFRDNRLIHWNMLKEAQGLMRRGQVSDAIVLYERSLRKNLHTLYADPAAESGYIAEAAQDVPSLNWAACFLIEYYIQKRVWREWLAIIDPLLPHLERLPLSSRSRLTAGIGWANSNTPLNKTLKKETDAQMRMLALVGAPSFEAGLHCIVLGKLYQQLRDHRKALYYLELAAESIDTDREPFYAIQLEAMIGSTYYFLNDFDRDYYKRAEAISREVEAKAAAYNRGVDFTLQAYNLGWIYAEQELFDRALAEFRRGQEDAERHLTEYETALYAYGIGYTYLGKKAYETAAAHIEAALYVFNDQSDIMTAVCLHLMGLIGYETADYDYAIEKEGDALQRIKKVDNPLQLYHICRLLFLLHLRQNRLNPATLRFGFRTYLLKMKLKKPLFPV